MIRNSFESYPDNENKLFSWEGTHEMKLEKFSRKAPHSWPEIRKQTFFLSRYSGNSAGKIFQECSSLMTRNQKFWKKSGKIFQETLWVTTRFLEIFSRIWQYGLTDVLVRRWSQLDPSPTLYFGKQLLIFPMLSDLQARKYNDQKHLVSHYLT